MLEPLRIRVEKIGRYPFLLKEKGVHYGGRPFSHPKECSRAALTAGSVTSIGVLICIILSQTAPNTT